MKKAVLAMVLSVVIDSARSSQNGDAFEAVSIKAVDPSAGVGGSSSAADPHFIFYRSVGLMPLIMKAFRVSRYQCHAPAWLDDVAFDISAKIPQGASPSELPEMLRSMLIERFGLQTHWESRNERGYGLVAARGGPRLKMSDQGPASGARPPSKVSSAGHVELLGVSMERFSGVLSSYLGRPVVDSTHLLGEFDVSLDFDPSSAPAFANMAGTSARPDLDSPSKTTLFSAVETLGLKLSPQDVSTRRLIVDHVERRPTAN